MKLYEEHWTTKQNLGATGIYLQFLFVVLSFITMIGSLTAESGMGPLFITSFFFFAFSALIPLGILVARRWWFE